MHPALNIAAAVAAPTWIAALAIVVALAGFATWFTLRTRGAQSAAGQRALERDTAASRIPIRERRSRPRPARSEVGGSECVLVADDEPAVRTVLARGLRRLGYDVAEASSLSQAVKHAEEKGGDLAILVTDVVMPDASGRELAAAVGEKCPGIRVLFISAYADDFAVGHGILDPGVAFLHKPFDVTTLAGKVRELLDRDAPTAAGAEGTRQDLQGQ